MIFFFFSPCSPAAERHAAAWTYPCLYCSGSLLPCAPKLKVKIRLLYKKEAAGEMPFSLRSKRLLHLLHKALEVLLNEPGAGRAARANGEGKGGGTKASSAADDF